MRQPERRENKKEKVILPYTLKKTESRNLLKNCQEQINKPANALKQAWEKLKQYFRPDSSARAVALTDEYFSYRINEGESMPMGSLTPPAYQPA
ncbi:hypothetical protein CEXT_765341 [Caerostris extrusa]|uniref:Uncharacterized protein n=1 Tax=Caerostris extrusa TaxID=172846 RepID=A0AAV4M415_CAEEX|nr:hypothetical protein CEXT_765341 [Caerostris extrusa]